MHYRRIRNRFLVNMSFTLAGWIFLLTSLPSALAQSTAPPRMDQEVIPYTGKFPVAPQGPFQEMPYPEETPRLLASWQGQGDGPEASLAVSVDDRDATTPVTWWVWSGQSATDVTNFVA